MNDTQITLPGWIGGDVTLREVGEGRRVAIFRWPAPRDAATATATWADGTTSVVHGERWRTGWPDHCRRLAAAAATPSSSTAGSVADVWATRGQAADARCEVVATSVGHDLTRGTSALHQARAPSSRAPAAEDGRAARARGAPEVRRRRGRRDACRREAPLARRLADAWLSTSSHCAMCARPTATRSSSTTSPSRSSTAPRSASSDPTAPASPRCSRSWPGSTTPTTATRSSTPAPRSACSSRSRR